MTICHICEKRCLKKWIGQTKDLKYHFLCRVDGLIVGQPFRAENKATWPKEEKINPLQQAEELGLQGSIEDFV